MTLPKLDIVLPDSEHRPAHRPKAVDGLPVTALVRFELVGPEIRVRGGQFPVGRACVPEASVDEDSGLPSQEHEVRPPWQACGVPLENDAKAAKRGFHLGLGLEVVASDRRHYAGANVARYRVHGTSL